MRDIIIAKREHLPHIATLESKTFDEPWSEQALELFLKENAFCVACYENDELASYCTVMTVLDEAQIINVATDNKYKRQGCGADVIKSVLEECTERALKMVSLEVRESNVPAITLYKNFGFSIEGKRKDFYKNPRENALVMIKNLD